MYKIQTVNKPTIFVFMVLLSFNASSQGDWALEKSEAGIKIYTTAIAGSQYRAFKAVATIRSPFEAVECIIRNTDSYAKWLAYTKRTELLRKTHNEKFVYMETVFPWPFSNEDMIYKISFTPGNSEIKIVLQGVPGYRPPVDGVNRMHGANGYLLLINKGDATEVIYTMHSELRGNIPAWLANQNIHELPFKTLTNLRAMAEKGCQQNHGLHPHKGAHMAAHLNPGEAARDESARPRRPYCSLPFHCRHATTAGICRCRWRQWRRRR